MKESYPRCFTRQQVLASRSEQLFDSDRLSTDADLHRNTTFSSGIMNRIMSLGWRKLRSYTERGRDFVVERCQVEF